jgi:hypothetical protein
VTRLQKTVVISVSIVLGLLLGTILALVYEYNLIIHSAAAPLPDNTAYVYDTDPELPIYSYDSVSDSLQTVSGINIYQETISL